MITNIEFDYIQDIHTEEKRINIVPIFIKDTWKFLSVKMIKIIILYKFKFYEFVLIKYHSLFLVFVLYRNLVIILIKLTKTKKNVFSLSFHDIFPYAWLAYR